MINKPDSALIIVAHGSTENEDSSSPTWQNVFKLRERNCFGEVHACFWKEEPSMREILYSVERDDVYFVPNFISEGYFTQDVIPRELELDGPITLRDGKVLKYCDPVGLHLSMTKLLKLKAEEVAPDVPQEKSTLLIVGHGTKLNDKSREAVVAQVNRLKEETRFAQILDTYMEEEPLITNWAELAEHDNVVVVPFFISDGLHSYQDIPVMLGIEEEPTAAASQREVFRHNPHHLKNRALYYASAIGTHPQIIDVILDQVQDFDRDYGALLQQAMNVTGSISPINPVL